MINDALLSYSSAQALTDTAASTNVVSHTVTSSDLGAGEDLWLIVNVTTAGADFTSLTIALQTDADEAFGSAVTLYTSPTIALAALTLGATVVKVRIPSGAWETYSRVYYTLSDAGTVSFDAFLTKNPDTYKSYASGFSIH